MHPNRGPAVPPAALVGLLVGLAAGFLASEFWGGRAPGVLRRVLPDKPAPDRAPADLAAELEERLEQALGPDAPSLELVPVGRQAIELHGWVPSRLARSRALGIARDTLGPGIRLVDCLLVWGEDDQPTGEHPTPLQQVPG
jgi:hypothetical protein